jgi:hypothetical protein
VVIWQLDLFFTRAPALSAARVVQGYANAGNQRVAFDMMVDGTSFPAAWLGAAVMLVFRRK